MDFYKLDLAKAEWNSREASGPATIVAFRLVEAVGARAHEPGVPEAGVITTVGDDSLPLCYWIGGVICDVFDRHLSSAFDPSKLESVLQLAGLVATKAGWDLGV